MKSNFLIILIILLIFSCERYEVNKLNESILSFQKEAVDRGYAEHIVTYSNDTPVITFKWIEHPETNIYFYYKNLTKEIKLKILNNKSYLDLKTRMNKYFPQWKIEKILELKEYSSQIGFDVNTPFIDGWLESQGVWKNGMSINDLAVTFLKEKRKLFYEIYFNPILWIDDNYEIKFENVYYLYEE